MVFAHGDVPNHSHRPVIKNPYCLLVEAKDKPSVGVSALSNADNLGCERVMGAHVGAHSIITIEDSQSPIWMNAHELQGAFSIVDFSHAHQ